MTDNCYPDTVENGVIIHAHRPAGACNVRCAVVTADDAAQLLSAQARTETRG